MGYYYIKNKNGIIICIKNRQYEMNKLYIIFYGKKIKFNYKIKNF